MVAIRQILADGIGLVSLIHHIHRRWLEMTQGMSQRQSQLAKDFFFSYHFIFF